MARALASYIALLRGINVGGKNKLPMKDLTAIFEEAGCANVRTYIQSGNVVFKAGAALAANVPTLVAQAIQDQFGIESPVVLRGADELAAVVNANPYLKAGADADKLHIAFLADTPSPQAVKALDPQRSPGDTFSVIGRDIHLHLPNGVGRCKLTNAWFDSKLKTVSTVRNWRTVLALLELAQA